MVRSFSQVLTLNPSLPLPLHHRRHALLLVRYSSSSSSSPDPLLRKLEDVIHHIIVRRSEPDWLPFRPGSSYWVPPRSKSRGIAQLIGKLATTTTPSPSSSSQFLREHSISAPDSHPRGWPSSAYFIHGTTPSSHPVPIEDSEGSSDSEDDQS